MGEHMEKEVTINDYTGLGAFEVSFEMLKLAEKK